MHVKSQVAALDHRARLTERFTCLELLEKATASLPAALFVDELYVRADGRLLLMLGGESSGESSWPETATAAERDVIVVDLKAGTRRFERWAQGPLPGALLWSRLQPALG